MELRLVTRLETFNEALRASNVELFERAFGCRVRRAESDSHAPVAEKATTMPPRPSGCGEGPSDATNGWRDDRDLVNRAIRAQHSCDNAVLVFQTGDTTDDDTMPELPEDEGAFPSPAEVSQAMNRGVCDSVDLVGQTVLYQTDERGGKRYTLPAIVTCVQRTHPDLPAWRAAQEQGVRHDGHGIILAGITDPEKWKAWGIVDDDGRGPRIGDNPVPIPVDGTAHLHVLTPGPKGYYTELSVPFDPKAAPRSFRYHPDSIPF